MWPKRLGNMAILGLAGDHFPVSGTVAVPALKTAKSLVEVPS